MNITIHIQAHRKYCGWCHLCKHIVYVPGGETNKWFCDAFALDLKHDKGKALRHEKCKEAEVEQCG